MKVMYIANDGKQFEIKEKCLEYERRTEDSKKAEEALTIIKEICNKYYYCSECPFKRTNTFCVFDTCNFSTPADFLDYFKGQ